MTVREELETIRSDIQSWAEEGYAKTSALEVLKEVLILLDKHKGETL